MLFVASQVAGATVRMKSCTLMMTTASSPRLSTTKRSLFLHSEVHDLPELGAGNVGVYTAFHGDPTH